MNFLAVHGSHVLELSPYVAKIDPNLSCFKTHLGKIPRDTFVLLLSLLDLALQSTVGERVARVELKVALIGEEATSSLGEIFLISLVVTTVAERSTKCSRPGSRLKLLSRIIGN